MSTGLHHVLDAAGPQAAHIGWLWWLTVAICAAVFVAVLVALALALRRAPRADATSVAHVPGDEPRTRRNVTLAVGISIAGLVVLLLASVTTDRALAQLSLVDAVNIEVVGHQFWWDVHYDDADPSRTFSTANEIHIPVGRPVIVTLKSDDVIHSLWVPSLHGKKDLIPGRTATLTLRADRPGTYRGQCAEFCGMQHAMMAFLVIADPPEQFAAWADRQRAAAADPATDEQKRGRDLFLSGSCMLCHAIGGTTAGARKAPDLTHLATRSTIAAGTLPNDGETLREWIEDPQRLKPGVNMPSHHVSDADLDALVAYLGALK
jgi:cytochrome c oxidase subunit 2